MGGSKEAICSQLIGAILGSLLALYVDISTTGPGIRLGCHFFLLTG